MFEIPEILTLTRQMNETLLGKTIRQGDRGNTPHKFVWYNQSPEEFDRLCRGKRVGEAYGRGRWLFLPLEPGYRLVLGECGGKILYHPSGMPLPKSYHMMLTFDDGSSLSATTQMWGAMELYETGQELQRPFIQGMRPTPVDPEFNWGYFNALLDELVGQQKRSVKSLLTQDQLIPGLGNSIAQDILFEARLHPKHPIQELDRAERWALYDAIRQKVQLITEQGGRYDEYDLFGQRGSYVRLMDKNALQRPCPGCGGAVQKINYLGGACYFCPVCQQ